MKGLIVKSIMVMLVAAFTVNAGNPIPDPHKGHPKWPYQRVMLK